jgi:hypothetical protein
MGVISIRLNKDEKKILKKFYENYHEDKSALVKNHYAAHEQQILGSARLIERDAERVYRAWRELVKRRERRKHCGG